jgi:predicted RND superfamily exporter protein
MQWLLRWSYKHPFIVIALILLGSGLAVPQARRIRTDASAKSLMINGDPAREFYQDTLEKFGSDSVMVVYLEDGKLFTPAKLERFQELVDALTDIPGVLRCESLFSVPGIRNENGLLESGPLLDWIPETDEECALVRQNALRNPLLLRNLISADGRSTAVNLYLEPNSENRNFVIETNDRIETILAEYTADFSQIFQLGTPYTWKVVTRALHTDQKTLVPISVAVLLLMLMVTLRSVSAAVLPMLTAGVSVLWTLGFMGVTGIPLNILTLIVPSLIIVLGSTEDIHLLAEYSEGLEHTGERTKAIEYMSGKVGTAVLLTALTTFLGFLSIAVNRIDMLKQFGFTAAFGLFVNPVITCMVTPVYLRYFGRRKVKEAKANSIDRWLDSLANRILQVILTHKRLVLTCFLGLAAVLGLFSVRMKVDNDMLGYFKKSSPIIQRVNTLHERLSGAQMFYIRVSSGFPGTFEDPKNLRQIDRLEETLNSFGCFDKIGSLTDYLKLVNREMNAGKDEFYQVPKTKDLVSQYLLFLQPDDIERFVTPDFSEVNIVVRHTINSSHELKTALARCEKEIQTILNPHFSYGFTGENILINQAADTIAVGQAKGIVLLLVVIFIIMSIMFVNLKASLLSLVPNIFPVAILFGVMGIFGIPLNPGTCMVAAIAIGLALDDTIHFMTRYNTEMHTLKSEKKAVVACLQAEFKPVIATSIALTLGFAALGLSNFIPIISFGLLSALVMVFALIGDLFLTPILLSSTKLLTLWDMLSLKLKGNVVEQSELFRELSPRQIKKIVLMGRIFTRQKGEFIYRDMEEGDSMFFVLEGAVRIFGRDETNGKEISYALLAPSDVFGEIALLDAGARAENAVAAQDVRYVEFTGADFVRLHRLYPRTASHLYQNLARILGHRLVVTNWMYRESKAKLENE